MLLTVKTRRKKLLWSNGFDFSMEVCADVKLEPGVVGS